MCGERLRSVLYKQAENFASEDASVRAPLRGSLQP